MVRYASPNRFVTFSNLIARAALLVAGLTSAAPPLTAQTALTTVRVASGLPWVPTDLTAPRNDFERLFITIRTGAIRIVKSGVLLTTPFLDLQSVVRTTDGEQGLLGLAFHPDYAVNRHFYVYYTRNPDGWFVVARYTATAANPDLADASSAAVLLTVPRSATVGNHNGGAIEFGADGYLYFATGDGGVWECASQDTRSLLGKLCRIDVDRASPYAIPPTNPFVGNPAFRPEIWAYGLRNPWRFSVDRLTGDIHIADVGGSLEEEIDFQPAGVGGQNYGWTVMEGNACLTGNPCPPTAPPCGSPTFQRPLHTYGHTNGNCSITGGYVYRGCAVPDLRGAYFFADWCSGRIWSLRHSGGTVTSLIDRTAELAPGGGLTIDNVTSFGEDANGELYMCDMDGEIYKIVPTSPVLVGLSAYGQGTPGCSGPQQLGANCSPTLHNPGWRFICANAPTNSLGIMLLSNTQDVAGTVALGLRFHVGVAPPSALIQVGFATGPTSPAVLPFPLPNAPALVRARLYAQAVTYWGATCSLPPLGLSASNGLAITVQP